MTTPVDGAQSTNVESQSGNVPEGTPPQSGLVENATAPQGNEAIAPPPTVPIEQAVPLTAGVIPTPPPYVDALSAPGEQGAPVAQTTIAPAQPSAVPSPPPVEPPPAALPPVPIAGETMVPPTPQPPNAPVATAEIPVHHTEVAGIPAAIPTEIAQMAVVTPGEPAATPQLPPPVTPVPTPQATTAPEPYGLDEHFGHAPPLHIERARDLLKPVSDPKLAASLEEIVSHNVK